MRTQVICICVLLVTLSTSAPLSCMTGEDPAPLLEHSLQAGRVTYHDRTGLPLRPPGSTFYDVSEFMLGSVAIVVILPESDGSIDPNLEDWTQTELDTVTTEVLAGLAWWVNKAKWRDLSFHPVFRYSVPTAYEPITHSSYDEALWVTDVMANMGYAASGYPLNMYEYANDVRDSLETDWAVLIFIVDSSDDEDGLFANGVAAYSYLGGPNMITSYKNGNAGIGLMDWVISHELAHSFYAYDEYHELSPPCTVSIGYLNVENQNSIAPYGPGGCALNIGRCIMRLSAAPNRVPCYYTKGQIGWWDSDADSIPDILDTFPETVLYAYSPDPCSTSTPTYAGTCWVVKVPNRNPLGEGNDITLEHISTVEFRVDDGAWNEAAAVDGGWDETEEDFHFTTPPLTPGAHVIEARAVQTCGNYDTTFAADTITVLDVAGVLPGLTNLEMDFKTCPNPSGNDFEVMYTVPGRPGDVTSVSICVYDVKGRLVRSLLDRIDSAGHRRVSWDGTLSDGSAVPSGIYFVRMSAGEASLVKKIAFIR
jgi:hypothetical protein